MLLVGLTMTAMALLPGAPLDRRAVLSGVVAAAPAALLAPLPAVARSKEKAAEKALQKATAAEARQAMKEYKYAPRPELVGNAKDGYAYKAGTVQAGSTGELASYFTDKGADIQADYKLRRAKEMGLSDAEAKAQAQAAKDAVLSKKRANQKKAANADDEKIKAKLKEYEGVRDDMGRLVGI